MPFLRPLLCSAALVLAAVPLAASAWPTKPLKLILSVPPGLPPDVMARGLAQQLEQRLGQPVVVENRAGASGNIAAQACATAEADGHTLCVLLNDATSLNPHLFKKLPYDADKGFAPVAILAWPNSAIVISSSVPAKTFAEVVALSKSKPGTLNWGSFGNGSSSHLYLEWIRSKTGWDVTHVPYRASPLQAVLAGEAQVTYMAIGALKPHIDAGKLVPIAVAGAQRSPFLPNVPTFAEVGLGEFYVRTWFGLFAPAGTPQAVVDQVAKESLAIVNDPGFKTKVMDPLTLTPGKDGPREMRAYITRDRDMGASLVKTANVSMD